MDGINTNETIQQQLNNISNGFVTLDTTQTITGNKTISGTTSLTGNLDVSGISISPQELSYLDGLQSVLCALGKYLVPRFPMKWRIDERLLWGAGNFFKTKKKK